VRRIEQFLANKSIDSSDQKNVKFYVAAMLARDLTGLEKPVHEKLPHAGKIDDKAIASTYHRVHNVYTRLSKKADRDAVARGPIFLRSLEAHWKRRQAVASSAE